MTRARSPICVQLQKTMLEQRYADKRGFFWRCSFLTQLALRRLLTFASRFPRFFLAFAIAPPEIHKNLSLF